MKPLYFPYTFVSRQTARAVSGFFNNFVVYQPSADPLPAEMQALADSGLLDVQIPDPSNSARIDDVVKNFRRWGNQQRTGEEVQAAVLRSNTDPVPLFDESSASQIVADFRDHLSSSPAGNEKDSTFEARVFLAFAQEFDRQNEEIKGDLGAYKDKVRHLFADINAEGNNPVKEPLAGLEIRQDDPAEYMVLRRLEAWAGLHDKDNANSGILLTSSPVVMEHILAHIPSVEKIHQFKSLSSPTEKNENFEMWQKNMLMYLIDLTQVKRPAAPDLPPEAPDLPPEAPDLPPGAIGPESIEANLSLSVHLIPDLMPKDCLAGCISASPPRTGGPSAPTTIRNTVIGLIEPFDPSK